LASETGAVTTGADRSREAPRLFFSDEENMDHWSTNVYRSDHTDNDRPVVDGSTFTEWL
jgi:hypothetical protein